MKNPVLLLLLFCVSANAQDSLKAVETKKPNKIIFFEYYFGFGGGNTSGFVLGASANYQNKKDLFTFRLGGFAGFNQTTILVGPLLDPLELRSDKIVDYSLLYGKRWIGERASFSVSGGFSMTNWKHEQKIDDHYKYLSENSVGFPFELNLKWFKKEKQRLKAYGLIPISRGKVPFGGSFGFKIVGNISKTNYIGFAFNMSFGMHKKY
jgi:hypothetical protein